MDLKQIFPRRKSPSLQKALQFILYGICDGGFDTGSRLPPVSSLCKQADVSPVTMWKAIDLLKKKKILIGEKGHCPRIGSVSQQDLKPADPVAEPAGKLPKRAWHEIRERLLRDILTGSFPQASRLPSVKELLNRYDTSYRTLQHAISELCAEGFIRSSKRGYAVRELKAGGSSVGITVFGWGNEKGELDLGNLGREIIRQIESACIQANIHLDLVSMHFDEPSNSLRFISVYSGKDYVLRESAQTMGYAILMIRDDKRIRNLLMPLALHKKPICVLDFMGGWKIREGLNVMAPITILSAASSIVASNTVARYLSGLGHARIAYLSPFHATSWSRARFDHLQDVFSHAGAEKRLYGYTLDNYFRDFIPQKWRKLMTEPPSGHSYSRFIDMSAQETKMRSATLRVIQKRMEPLLDKALLNKEITAWIGSNDDTALIALDFLKTKSVDVPGKISVVGFDNSYSALSNNLTSYSFNYPSAVYTMISSIVHPRIRSSRKRDIVTEIEGAMIVRGTAGRSSI